MATISIIDLNLPTSLIEGGYSFDAEASVWLPPDRLTLCDYSDGDEAEERLAKSIERCIDIRTGSSALAAEIHDWTSEYHLSALRANLLRPVTHLLRGDTLEIGAGCGALTRYIGELDGRLLAVEGSLRRAKIAAARCNSLDNTSVVCDNLDSLNVDHRFDTVVLVGVLEYCRLFSSETDPVAFLRRCRRFLKPSGCLILAIENKLGLKYLCGAPEDHVGERYFGIEDRYSSQTAVTWGRSELLGSLRSAGWNHVQELFPFPDYKLPHLVLTRKSLSYGSLVNDLLRQYGPALETGTPFHRSFSEPSAWKVIAENRLVPEFANSFLLVASQSAVPEIEGAFIYSANRHRSFQCETRINNLGGKFQVQKSTLYPDSQPSTAKFKWCPAASPFRHGQVYSGLLETIFLSANWGYDEIILWAHPYHELLASRIARRSSDGKDTYLSGDQLDCGPHNLSLRNDGKLEDFDVEWISLHDVPLGYVFFRSLLHCLNKLNAVAPSSTDDSTLHCVQTVMNAFSLRCDDEVLTEYLDRESKLQSFVAGRRLEFTLERLKAQTLKKRAPSLLEVQLIKTDLERVKIDLGQVRNDLASEKAATAAQAGEMERLRNELADAAQRLREADQELQSERSVRAALEQSLSWRLTRPLRTAKSLARPHSV